MSNERLYKTIGAINMGVLLILATDTWFLQPVIKPEILYGYEYIENDSGIDVPLDSTCFFIAKPDKKYRLPEGAPHSVDPGDTFYVEKSHLFRTALKFRYRNYSKEEISVKCGTLNEGIYTKIIACFVLIVSLVSLFGIKLFKNINYQERLVFSGMALTAFLIFAYFFNSIFW